MKQFLLMTALASLALDAGAAGYQLTLGPATRNTALPSGSALSYHDGHLYAVGDDAAWRYQLDNHFAILEKQLLLTADPAGNGRIAKKTKPDLEAMATVSLDGRECDIILGSGSKHQTREKGYLLCTGAPSPIERDLAPVYRQLYQAGQLSGKDKLNIEGLAIAGEQAYLFNRGNLGRNLIFAVDSAALVSYLQGKRDNVGRITSHPVQLPAISGIEAGLSGADYWPQQHSLVYTASVEGDAAHGNDGSVLGSFTGVIPLAKLEPGKPLDLRQSAIPLLREGLRVPTKVESIAITSSTATQIEGIFVSDNDNGSSEFFHFTLQQSP